MFHASKLIRQCAIWIAATAIILTGAACPPPATTTGPQPVGPETTPPPPEKEDLSIELDEVKLTGARFVPEGLGRPGMIKVTVKRKTTLAKQRKAFARAKPNKKSQEAMVLVSMLWNAATDAANALGPNADDAAKEAAKKPFYEEARTVLRDAYTALGEQADPLLMRMLFIAETWLDSTDEALKVGADMMARHPESKNTKAVVPWTAYWQLRQWKTDEAAAIAQGWTLADEDMNYLRAYVMMWIAIRQGNYDAAREAAVYAATNWRSAGNDWGAMERELMLVIARSNTATDQAFQVVLGLPTGAQTPQDDLLVKYLRLYKLYEAYEKAGYSARAATVLDKALEIRGDQVPGRERVIILTLQSNNYLVAHQPDKAADLMIAAYNAVAPCGEPCQGQEEETADKIDKLSTHLHNIYATTLDETYFGPAKKLYEFYLSKDHKQKATIQSYLTRLDETKQTAVAASGKHDKKILDWSTKVRNAAITACYERVLQRETELKGSFKLILNIDDTGKVTGAETDPAAGAEGMAAVAGCVSERAREWAFPGRSKKGMTAVVRTYLVEPAPVKGGAVSP